MLNKLLKRCMPWMDKGRWYKIQVIFDATSGNVKLASDPVFQNAHIEGQKVVFVNPVNLNIIDYKFIPFQTFEEFIPPSEYPFLIEDGAYSVKFPTAGTYWLYMR